ncbi:MAG: hypothetical protein ACRDPC_24510 [Solirubrobacteraceae bacterium]
MRILRQVWPTEDEFQTVWAAVFLIVVYHGLIGVVTLLGTVPALIALPPATALFLLMLGPLLEALWQNRPFAAPLILAPRPGSVRVRPFVRVVAYTVVLWGLAVTLFALAAHVVDRDRLTDLARPGDEFDGYTVARNLFIWHLLDAIPAVGATDALRWSEPVDDRSVATGLLIVLYKLLVLVPVVAAVGGIIRARAPGAPPP